MSVSRTTNLPRIALVGRTNVGKSTLWNRLTSAGHALVSAKPHTTRDRKYGIVLWKGSAFELTDTGGMDTEPNSIGEGIKTQSEKAIREADLVLFIIDAKTGVTAEDLKLAKLTKSLNKHVWLVVNKTDTLRDLPSAVDAQVFRLALGSPQPVSANTSFGIGDLLDALHAELERLNKPPVLQIELRPLRIVLIGQPNVGKSSIVNAILGEERVIVSPIAHTTREPQDTYIRYKGHDITLVDTAGMRRRAKIEKGLEEEGVELNRRALESADVALMVFDSTGDPTTQDRHLAGLVEETHKGIILVANKWDLVKFKDTATSKRYEDLLRQLFPFLSWAPMVFVSAVERQRMTRLLDMAIEIQNERLRHIDYNAVNRILKSTMQAKKPLQSYGPKSPRVYDVAQIGYAPPTFLVTVHGEKDNLHPSWLKFFEKRLRLKFSFLGTPIRVRVQHLPLAKSQKRHNVRGPGMEAVAGKIKEKVPKVNQTRRRQKHGGHRY